MKPKAARPPITPTNTASVGTSARPEISIGRRKLSTMPTTIAPQAARKIAWPNSPRAARNSAPGTQTSAAPIIGTSATSAATTPKTSGEGSPTIQNPTPTRMPCTSAVRPMPRNTARVTSARCCQSRARRRSSTGSICTTCRATAGPSRSTKNSTNSMRTKLAAVPSALITNEPPDDTSASSSRCDPSTSQPCSCTSEMELLASIHSSARCSHGRCPRSNDRLRPTSDI